MDCYEIEVQRLHNLIEEQVYATWSSYQDVTSMGVKKEFLLYDENLWIDGTASYTLLSSPWLAIKGAAYYAKTGIVQHANLAAWGARPALYD